MQWRLCHFQAFHFNHDLYSKYIGIFRHHHWVGQSLALFEKTLVQGGDCTVLINDDQGKNPQVPAGTNLLTALSNQRIFIPSAPGGGSCGMCKVKVFEGGGEVLPTELPI